MKENLLKKQFTSQDVTRLRNILGGNDKGKTCVSVGYEKDIKDREEGEIWEEDGRKWVIKNGVRQNLTKIKTQVVPLFCPECNNKMNPNDKVIFLNHKKCLNCQIKFETNLKLKGKWNKYKDDIINEDVDNFIQEYSEWMDEEIQKSNILNITEGGDEERWKGDIKDKLLKDKEETLEFLRSLRK